MKIMLTKEMMEKGLDRNCMVYDSDAKPGELTSRLILLMQSINLVNNHVPLTDLYVPPMFEHFACINYISPLFIPGNHHLDIIKGEKVSLEKSYEEEHRHHLEFASDGQIFHAVCGGLSLHLDSRLEVGGELYYEDQLVTGFGGEDDKYIIVGMSKDKSSVQLGSL
jgi:hypothetical protein